MVRASPPSTWMQGLDIPSQRFGDTGGSDYELYEKDDEFVLTIDMRGFETEVIEVAWDDGVLNVTAEQTDENHGRKKTDHRRFLPQDGRRRGDRRRPLRASAREFLTGVAVSGRPSTSLESPERGTSGRVSLGFDGDVLETAL
ncbi:Hsp20/alpha crystallin family protein [Natrinema altunense]|uniref:Hsp20/alpha crystallin family protein n=1 Tax=Natrinema altunense TaxID=222984 RepID=UPI001EF9F721|nr:Hsp20 family protein [Natrinema altunense]